MTRDTVSLGERIGQIEEAGRKKVEVLRVRETDLKERLEQITQLVTGAKQEADKAAELLARVEQMTTGPQRTFFEEHQPELEGIQQELQRKSWDLSAAEAELVAVSKEIERVQRQLSGEGENEKRNSTETAVCEILINKQERSMISDRRGTSVGSIFRNTNYLKFFLGEKEEQRRAIVESLSFRDALRQAFKDLQDEEKTARGKVQEALRWSDSWENTKRRVTLRAVEEDLSLVRNLMESFKVAPENRGV